MWNKLSINQTFYDYCEKTNVDKTEVWGICAFLENISTENLWQFDTEIN